MMIMHSVGLLLADELLPISDEFVHLSEVYCFPISELIGKAIEKVLYLVHLSVREYLSLFSLSLLDLSNDKGILFNRGMLICFCG